MIEIEPFNSGVTCIKTATAQDDREPIMWVYAFKIGDALFDAGCTNAISEFKEYVGSQHIDRIYITHAHEDHVGGISCLADKQIFAWRSNIELLKHPPELPEFFRFVWGQPQRVEAVQEMPGFFEVGRYHFETVELPGHFHDMVGFYEPEQKWLFSADAVPLPSRKYIAMPDENIPLMIKTMERINSMDIEVLFDSHRGPILNPHEHVQVRIDYLRDMMEKVRELGVSGFSVSEIIEALDIKIPWYIELTKERFSVDYFIESLLNDSA